MTFTPEQAAMQLRAFIREQRPGGCKMFSKGASCVCPLCAVDYLSTAARAGADALAREQALEQEAADTDMRVAELHDKGLCGCSSCEAMRQGTERERG